MTEGDRPPNPGEVPQPNHDGNDGGESETTVGQPASAPAETLDTVAAETAAGELSTPTESEALVAAETGETSGALAVVCGLPGVGKTTVAKRVAAHVDGEILRTDVIRKELFDDPEYSEAETKAVYAELIRRARERVAQGSSIVLDATFADARFREDARAVGDAVADGFDLIEVECDESVVERRIERRDGISDADFDIHLRFKELFDRIESDHLVVDNSGTESETFAQVDAAFAGDGGPAPGTEDGGSPADEALTAADGGRD